MPIHRQESTIKSSKQGDFFKKVSRSYGGDLLTKRKARSHGRPISTRHTMHFVLRSTRARGEWSFLRHRRVIRTIVEKFAAKYGIRVKSMANVGNHIHMHLQLTNRHTYRAFIRAITSAIMMAVTGASRWNKTALEKLKALNGRRKAFWDRRPFSRVIVGFKVALTIQDYIFLAQLEAQTGPRVIAREILSNTS